MKILYKQLEGEFYDYNINIRLQDNDITITFILPSSRNYDIFRKELNAFFEDYGYDMKNFKILDDDYSKLTIFKLN